MALRALEGFPVEVADTPTHGKAMQGVSKLLLLPMFAFAARYNDGEATGFPREEGHPEESISRAGHGFAADARRILSKLKSGSFILFVLI